MSEADYYLLNGDKEQGPWTLDELEVFWKAGAVTLETLYARPGMSEWKPLSTILGRAAPAAAEPIMPTVRNISKCPAAAPIVEIASSKRKQITQRKWLARTSPPRLLGLNERLEDAEAHGGGYFALMDEILMARKTRDFERMLVVCKESIRLLPFVIRSVKREFGWFDLGSIPAITQGCIFWSIFGRVPEIVTAQKFCRRFKDLEDWNVEFEKAKHRADLVNRIKTFIAVNPGFPQHKLKKSLGEADGRFLSSTVHYMEVAGVLRREKHGETYQLFAPSSMRRK